jgi:spore germination protein GerM
MPGVIELDNNEVATSVEYVDLTSRVIYLLDNDELLVETNVSIVDSGDIVDKIKILLKHLSEASSEIIPNGLNFVLSKDIELLDVSVEDRIVTLNFSKEFNQSDTKKLIRKK